MKLKVKQVISISSIFKDKNFQLVSHAAMFECRYPMAPHFIYWEICILKYTRTHPYIICYMHGTVTWSIVANLKGDFY